MSDPKKRKVHTPEFKAKVGLEALRGVKTTNQIGQDYDVHPMQIGLWKKEIQAQAKTLFEGAVIKTARALINIPWQCHVSVARGSRGCGVRRLTRRVSRI